MGENTLREHLSPKNDQQNEVSNIYNAWKAEGPSLLRL